jgi:hypothetical protein
MLATLPSCAATDGGLCDELDNSCNQPVTPPQYLSDFRQNNAMARPAAGTALAMTNLTVSAIDTYSDSPSNRTGNIYVQQFITADQLMHDPHFASFMGCAPYMGGAMCGIQVFGATIVPVGSQLLAGDLVNVNGGMYDEFTCMTCSSPFPAGQSLPELAMVTLQRIGSGAPPAPVPVSLATLAAGGNPYVGVLVTISDASVPLSLSSSGKLTLGTSGIELSTDLSPLVDGMGMPVSDTDTLSHLTGIVTYFYSLQFMPRSPADYVVTHGI